MAVQKQLYHMFNYWIHFSKFSNRKKSGSQSFPWLQNHFLGTELVIIVSYSVNLSRIIVLVGLHAKITLPKTAFIWFDKKHFIVINVIITCKQIMLCIKKTNPTSFFATYLEIVSHQILWLFQWIQELHFLFIQGLTWFLVPFGVNRHK